VKALRLLEQVIEDDLPLFDLDHEIAADRRVAWLCRIDLLREMGRFTEALAWACLECELHPDNVAAQAVKDELKRLTRFGRRGDGPGSLPPRPLVRWQGLAGMRQLRAELERDVILPLLNPERYRRYKLSLPNGILLYGPPGCGKTFIARKLAEIIGFHFVDTSPSDLGSVYVHGGQLLIKGLFDQARRKAPTMIFFDEFEALVGRRGDISHHYAAEVNEFLTQLNECAARRILVVAATNRIDGIDDAVLRPGRMDKKFYVGPPDLEARVELFRLYLADRPAVGVDYLALGDTAEGLTPADIREVVNEAARQALDVDGPIAQAHVQAAVRAHLGW
jgi:transitional endoplasmic reticulum ATPase